MRFGELKRGTLFYIWLKGLFLKTGDREAYSFTNGTFADGYERAITDAIKIIESNNN